MKALKIIQVCLSKTTPLTAERRRAIDAQAAEAEATVAFLDVTDVITVYIPDRLCRAPYDGGAEFVRAYHEARKRQRTLRGP